MKTKLFIILSLSFLFVCGIIAINDKPKSQENEFVDIYPPEEKTPLAKLLEENYDNIHFQWYGRSFFGYWKMYNLRYKQTFLYHFEDSGQLSIKDNSFYEGYWLYYFDNAEWNKNQTMVTIGICSSFWSHKYEFNQDSLFLYDPENINKVILYGVRISEDEYKKWAYFSTDELKIEPPLGIEGEIFEYQNQKQAVLYIGKDKIRPKNSLSMRIDYDFIEYEYNAILEFLIQKLNNATPKLINNFELVINADKNTPSEMLDSVKMIVSERFPKMKISRVFWDKAENKILKKGL